MKRFSASFLIFVVTLVFTVTYWTGCGDGNQTPTASASQEQIQAPNSIQMLGKQDSRIAQAAAIQERNEERVFGATAARGIGIGLEGGEVVFHVFVNSKASRPDDVSSNLEGIRVVRIETDDFVARFDNGPNHRTQLSAPVPAGVSTSNDNGCFAGTRGFLAYKSGQVGYITNSHVAAAGGSNLCPGSAPIGEPQYHLGTYDNNCTIAGTIQIGTLNSFVKFVGGPKNKVDAAFVASSTSLISASILDIGTPTTSAKDPALNMTVRKSGRTTGLTSGTITTINATVRVSYGSGCGTYTFTGQFVVTPGGFSAAGDSGSPVVDSGNNPVGLLFAGSSSSTICNPIKVVLTQLVLTF
jgi:hypothetical protein